MTQFYLDVRDDLPPHEAIGRLIVPYEVAIGERTRMVFEGRREGFGPTARVTTHSLEVHAFYEHGYRILAFKMSRREWDEFKEKLGQ